jgi:hypothetical protein
MTYAFYRRYTEWTLPSIPHLWDEAKKLFERALCHGGEAQSIARYARLHRARRREILSWFVPVDSIVRKLIVAKAIVHLLMTPQGRKLLLDAKRERNAPPPEPAPKPPKAKSAPYKISIPHPGWHTIWQPPRKQPPSPPPQPETQAEAIDPYDPASWSCPYRIAHYSKAGDGFCEEPPAKPRTGPRISVLDLDVIVPPRARRQEEPSSAGDMDPSAFRCAKRIELIRRVLENPKPVILRVARFLARQHPDSVDMPAGSRALPVKHWRQGDLYADQAREHGMLALRALHLSLAVLDAGVSEEPG